MARTIDTFLPSQAAYPTSNFPAFLQQATTRWYILAFDASTSETCYFTSVAPQGITTPLTAIIYYSMASATSGGVAFDVAIEAITPTDATDLDVTTSFASINGGNDATVPGTAGYLDTVSITLTNNDSISAGDLIRYSLARDVADANDTATGDCYVYAIEIRDSA